MGVSQFYKRFIKHTLQGKIKGLIKNEIREQVASLLLDANALIYEAKRFLFELTREYDAENSARVAKNLALSQDEQYQALAEQTWKMIQDRVQFIRPSKYVVIAFDGVVPVAKMKQQRGRRFRAQLLSKQNAKNKATQSAPDNNLISVGTDLMEFIHAHIRQEINALSYNYDVVFPSIVIYSSYHQSGEGEHKIVKYFRDNVIEYNTNEYHVIWGLDADLFMLGITLPTDKIILARDDGVVEFVNLEKFKLYLSREMRTINYVEDFLIIMAMMGNDFLPRIYAFNDLGTDIYNLLEIFKELRLQNSNFHLTFNKYPDLANILKFIAKLVPYQWQKLTQRLEDKTPSFLSQFKPDTLKSEFPKVYYDRELKYINLGQEPEISQEDRTQIRTEMAYYYFQGIYWILSYYLRGADSINMSYFYPYVDAPLLDDMIEENYKAGPANYWTSKSAYNIQFNILDQLMMTAPYDSPMLNWYSSQIRAGYQLLIDLAPAKFETNAEGEKVMWYDEPLLPQLEPLEVHNITNQYYEDQETYQDMPIQFKLEERDIQLKRNLKVPQIPRTTSINQALQGQFNKAMTPEQRNLLKLTSGFQRSKNKASKK